MTLKELWQLFPIYLTKHKEVWSQWYDEEERLLYALLSDFQVRIHHIGSTAIKDIWAKPIVDILVEIPLEDDLDKIKDLIMKNGYSCMAESTQSISFNKGYTEDGFKEKVFHLHLRYWGNNDELYFRDYLNAYPAIAKEYETLKLSLWNLYEYDRDGYTNAKHNFISLYTEKAKEEYKGRYE